MITRIFGISFGIVGGGYLIEQCVVNNKNFDGFTITILFILGITGMIYGLLDARKLLIQHSIDIRKLKQERKEYDKEKR